MSIADFIDDLREQIGGAVLRFGVVQGEPLVLEELTGDETLTEGDPDFSVGGWVRQHRRAYGLETGDVILVVREEDGWHALDVEADADLRNIGGPPEPHKASHETGGTDALTPAGIGAATAGHGHAPAAPAAHKSTHAVGGSDPLTPADIGAAAAGGAPTAHKATHAVGGTDVLTPADIGAAPLASPLFTGDPRAPTATPGDNDTTLATTGFVMTALGLYVPADAALTVKGVTKLSVAPVSGVNPIAVGDNDPRNTNARAPTAHKATHAIGGSDLLTPADIGAAAGGVTALSAVQVRDVGEVNQIRAGRVLTPADFTAMGLQAPAGLWNLSNTNDSSGNGRNLTNKGSVTFGSGIMGAATEAAIFTGSTGQALYIADTGASDAFRIRTGTVGCWFRTGRQNDTQELVTKFRTAGNQRGWRLITHLCRAYAQISIDGLNDISILGGTECTDDRWHFMAFTWDGVWLRLWLDGREDASVVAPSGFQGAFAIFGSNAPLNIGAFGADGATAGINPHFGRVDEAFVTPDVLSEEQVRNLYCVRVPHALGVVPVGSRLAVRRRRRGGPLVSGDFPSQPLRLHNFVADSGADLGSNNQALAFQFSTGNKARVAGADGQADHGTLMTGAHNGWAATDTGLPSGTNVRSYGAWFVCHPAMAAVMVLMGWGTPGAGRAVTYVHTSGHLRTISGADDVQIATVADGRIHHFVMVEDNAAVDGIKRKCYIDGLLRGGSATLNSITLAGALRFRVGANPDGTLPFLGMMDGAWVFNGALTPEQVHAIYNVGSLALTRSPKAEGAHVEALESASILALFDTLQGCDQVDLAVGYA